MSNNYGNYELRDSPGIKFYRFFKSAALPQRADRSAAGTLPTRASRYCEPVTTASSFGWWVYSPMDFTLLWDGEEIYWRWQDVPSWQCLSSVQFPDFAEKFDAMAPEAMRGYSVPFMTVLPEPGIVQIWTGLMAITAPGWSLLIRPLANLPNKGGYTLYEGIIETDLWFSPIITNIHLKRTNIEINISKEYPIAQIQPIPRFLYSEKILQNSIEVIELENFTNTDWENFNSSIVEPNKNPSMHIGAYAAAVRRRRRGNPCPHSGSASILSQRL